MIRDLLHRQHHHVKMTNTILAGHAQKLRVERNKLEKYQHDKINQELLKAAKLLNLPAYERFKSRLKRIHSGWTLEYHRCLNILSSHYETQMRHLIYFVLQLIDVIV